MNNILWDMLIAAIYAADSTLRGIFATIGWATNGLVSWVQCETCQVKGPIITDNNIDTELVKAHLHES